MSRIEYQVVHDTVYNYAYQAVNGQHLSHLTPRHTAHQEVLWHSLQFHPEPDESSKSRDYYGNHCMSVLIQNPHDSLHVTSTTLVRVETFEPSPELSAQPWETALLPSVYTTESLEVTDMRLPSPLVPLLPASQQYAARFLTPGRPWLEAMLELTQQIKNDFTYDVDATDINTPLAEVFAGKRGVCQDFAHVMLSCLRSYKLPARYVSGYILNEPPPGEEKLVGSDASHAWVETWLPGVGWVGFDPTNGKLANTEFIVIGWGRDYADVTPLRGVVLGGGEHELEVRVTVTRT
ncbi:MAG TPA: transglutaminase family protein [Candidatus Acidoferrum sp.]|nr:transglutaminase family protein [Candidatus Acidoferrum sp.]